MKRPDFEDVLASDKRSFSGFKGILRTTGFKLPPKYVGYLMGHSWGSPTVLTQKCIDFLIKLRLLCDR
jgi:hypothetical protein